VLIPYRTKLAGGGICSVPNGGGKSVLDFGIEIDGIRNKVEFRDNHNTGKDCDLQKLLWY
jgi:hypothetical protein